MSPGEVVAILLAGLAAGTINTVVGSGTLITFPTLLAFGLPPVTANVTNNVGLVPGTLSGVLGYRPGLHGQRQRVLRLATASLAGGLVGALLLLALPGQVFAAVVPLLILTGVVLVILQPRISAWAVRRHGAGGLPAHGAWWVWPGVLLSGVYGGYFGAAQGVLLMAVLGTGIDESLQRLNALKNVLALVVNSVAGVLFIVVAPIDWPVAALIAVGSVLGGQVGARLGQRLPDAALRAVVVAVGLVAVVAFLLS